MPVGTYQMLCGVSSMPVGTCQIPVSTFAMLYFDIHNIIHPLNG
jgi:hypothetical protein